VSNWPSKKASQVLGALFRLGWVIKRQSGSHRTLARPGWPDFIFAFHGWRGAGAEDARTNREVHGAHGKRPVRWFATEQGDAADEAFAGTRAERRCRLMPAPDHF
jgi:predicted RNA binding protein YcfA (HicA-like mRNA interferase family)